jgi:transcriptional regulator with XRE-family HTH domain
MKLSAWLKQNSMTQSQFLEKSKQQQAGFSIHALAKWCNGSRIPRQNEMQVIHGMTNGEVSPNDFYGLR